MGESWRFPPHFLLILLFGQFWGVRGWVDPPPQRRGVGGFGEKPQGSLSEPVLRGEGVFFCAFSKTPGRRHLRTAPSIVPFWWQGIHSPTLLLRPARNGRPLPIPPSGTSRFAAGWRPHRRRCSQFVTCVAAADQTTHFLFLSGRLFLSASTQRRCVSRFNLHFHRSADWQPPMRLRP